MEFSKHRWLKRIVQYPGRRILRPTGNSGEYDVQRSEGAITQAGDGFTEDRMNDLEERIYQAVLSKLDKDRIVNSLSANVPGFALDATQGKVLNEAVSQLNENLTVKYCANIDDVPLKNGSYYTDINTVGSFPSGFNKYGIITNTRRLGGLLMSYFDTDGKQASRFYTGSEWRAWNIKSSIQYALLKGEAPVTANSNQIGGYYGTIALRDMSGYPTQISSIVGYLPMNCYYGSKGGISMRNDQYVAVLAPAPGTYIVNGILLYN